MKENKQRDLKTARNLIITEFIALSAFTILGLFNSFSMFMAVGVVLISIPLNLFWIFRLLYNKPPKYGFYIAGLVLPVVTPLGFAIWFLSLLSEIQC